MFQTNLLVSLGKCAIGAAAGQQCARVCKLTLRDIPSVEEAVTIRYPAGSLS
jgi:hypothetical protein